MAVQFPQFSISDQTTGWNNPNKTEEQRQLLSSRGSLLNARMKYPLHLKIIMAKRRIQAVIDRYGVDGCHLAEENNFIKLKKRNPVLWKGVTNHWGFGKICKKCDIDYGEE